MFLGCVVLYLLCVNLVFWWLSCLPVGFVVAWLSSGAFVNYLLFGLQLFVFPCCYVSSWLV